MLTKQDETTVRNIVREETSSRFDALQKDVNRMTVLQEHQGEILKSISENLELTHVDREKANKLEERVENLELDVKVLKSAYQK